MVLLPIDPYWVHAYWELVTLDTVEAPGGAESPGGEKRCLLRVYDVTYIIFDGTNAHSFFDLEISPQARNWYINLWSPGKTLCAELGLVRSDGGFSPLVRSNVIQTPPAWASPNTGERWMRVEWKPEDRVPPEGHASIEGGGPVPQPHYPSHKVGDWRLAPANPPVPPSAKSPLRPPLPKGGTGGFGPGKREALSRPKEAIQAEAYRRFLERTRRVKILQTDEPAPPGPAAPPVEDVGADFDPGLSSIHLAKKPEGGG